MAVKYFEENVRSRLSDRRKLSKFLKSLVNTYRPEVKQLDLTFIFCNDDYLLRINQDYLNHETFTDIITFNLSETTAQLQGEIYISSERVQENAGKFQVDYTQELHRVIFHGVLHLCGFKDKTSTQKEQMRAEEDKCLKQYFNLKVADS